MAIRRTNPIHVAFLIPITVPNFSASTFSNNYRENQVVSRTFSIDWGNAPASGRTLTATESSPYITNVVISSNQVTVTLNLSNIVGNQTATVNLTATNSAGSGTAIWNIVIAEAGAMWTASSYSYSYGIGTGTTTIALSSLFSGTPTGTVSFSSGYTPPTGVTLSGTTLIIPLGLVLDEDVLLTVTNENGSDDATFAINVEVVAPTAPRNLVVQVGDSQLILTWDAPSDDGGSAIIRYEYRSGSNWISMGNVLTRTFTGLRNGITYALIIRAVNASINGAEASTTGTPLATTVPGPPRSLTLTPGNGQITASWNAPTTGGGVSNYEYRVGDTGSWTNVTGTSVTITNLENGTEYTVYIRAENNIGPSSAVSATITVGVLPSWDESHSSFDAEQGTNGQFVHDFSISDVGTIDLSDIISSYGLPTGTLALTDGFTLPSGYSLSGTILTAPTSGTGQEVIELTLTNDIGSVDAELRIDIDEAAGTPRNFTVTRGSGSGELDLSWSPPDNGGSPDTYEYRINFDGPWTDYGGSLSDLSATITGLENDTEYTIYLRAYNAQGESGEVSGTGTPRAALTIDTPADFTVTEELESTDVITTIPIPTGGSGPPYTITDINGATPSGFGIAIPNTPFILIVSHILANGAIDSSNNGSYDVTITYRDEEGSEVSVTFTIIINIT